MSDGAITAITRFIIQQIKAKVPIVNNEVVLHKSRNEQGDEVEPKLPCIILVGPDLTPTNAPYDIDIEPVADPETEGYDNRIYDDIIYRDIEFELIAMAQDGEPILELVNQIEFNVLRGMAQFEYPTGSGDEYDLDTMIGMGSGVTGSAGGRRPNLSNLRVSSGRFTLRKMKLRPDIYREGTLVTEKEVTMSKI